MSAKPAAKFGRNMLVRSASILFLAPPIVAAIYYGPPWLYLAGIAFAVAAVLEWVNITSGPRKRHMVIATLALLLTAILYVEATVWAASGLLIGIALTPLMVDKVKSPILLPLGIVYVGLAMLAFFYLGYQPALLLFVLLAVWSMDTGAYFAGRLIGGPKLAPKISPGKTWAGLWGGMAAAAIFGMIWAIFRENGNLILTAVLAGMLGGISQVGDLAESALKRRYGVKDSGNLIPGHGGVLDRVDSLLLAMPVFALLVAMKIKWLLPEI